MWLGNIYGRRKKILDKLCVDYTNLTIVTSGYFYKEKLNLISTSKIYINICGVEPKNEPLNLFKIKYAFLTKSLIISEKTPDNEMIELFQDCIIFVNNINEMKDKINYYLINEKERENITEKAFNIYKQLNLSDYIYI